jgi:hypothetical protein
MAANSSIVLTQLDFDSFKSSLKSYLQEQDRFKDYDFDGSNMSVLLDILAYNTYQNAFYLNMVSNEMFLDSAKLRDSVISHAKELNYLPRSFKSAIADIQLIITPTDGNATKKSILVPKGTSFVSRVDDFTYTFTVPENIIITNFENGAFRSDAITIYEGNYLSETYAINYNNPLIFKINNKTVDVSSILVTVIEDNGASILNYSRATSLFGYNSTSKIFFVQPGINDSYEIVFGDGVVGRKPKNGAVIIIEYRISNGELPNGAFKFVNTARIDGVSNVIVNTISPAHDGAVAEDLNSIKYNAPRAFTTQERAITAEDYENLLKINFAEINAVTAYGGEDATPPQYGRIFVSVDLKGVDGLPKIKESEYKKFLKTRSSVAMEPIFVSPDYTYLKVSSNVKYNINKTGLNPEDIRTYVIAAIQSYAFTYLNNFARTLRYSRLVNDIDNAESSIISNETDVELIKYITPQLNVSQNLTIDFKMPLTAEVPLLADEHPIIDIHAITSTPFTYAGISNCTLEDNGDGKVRIVTPVGSNHKTIIEIGTVNYDTGVVSLNNFIISQYVGTSLKVYGIPRNKDISSSQNVILNIVEPDISINIEQIRE